MFTRIDEVDWASLRHAYGSAEDVPRLLRGLASPDPAERETALDGMYGAVHHQGDVYDSTLACVPFLFALLAEEEVAERGSVLDLLVSIGGGGEDDDAGEGEHTDDEGGLEDSGAEDGAEDDGVRLRRAARDAVCAGADVFAALAGDADPGVRQAAARALVLFLDEPARVLGALLERIAVERDERVLIGLVESLGRFARRHPGHAADAVDLLVRQSGPPYAPGVRLAALGRLADCAPDRLPAGLVPTVVRLLRDRSARRPARPAEPDRPPTDTLIGRLRLLRPSDEEGDRLLRTLHNALDDRVADRIALLTGQLTLPDPVDRCNAVWMSAGLFRTWRGDYARPVALIGEQLGEDDDGLRDAAVSVLEDLFTLAAPAADSLAALVSSRPDLWIRHWERGEPNLGHPLRALARTGDARAVPPLAEVLAGPVVPYDTPAAVVPLGPAAAPLAPALRRRLAESPLDVPEPVSRIAWLLTALRALADAEAAPVVLRLLRRLCDGSRPAADTLVPHALRTLAAFGPAARESSRLVRRLLDSGYAVAAAEACWAVERDAGAVLPVLLRELERDGRAAAQALARLGPEARPAVPALRRLTGSARVWDRTDAACALARITGDVAPVAPVLRAAWEENPHTRPPIAECLAALDGAAAAPLRDLAEAELATRRRYTARTDVYGSHDVLGDEELLRVCRAVATR
ncbi:HEAT repeat domain-containing protein [Streptomyces sp. NPDC052676]|uniref:HEAT repeat domain-containing protein n=1 Tax=Streptomyces sp. NPDC052676 TaxID=3154953 RepID=UPI00342F2AB3